jgi:hypothetical protein
MKGTVWFRTYAALREDVFGREVGACVACLTYTALSEGECHHRKLRSRGGLDDAWNCIWLCGRCHRWAHDNPTEATSLGYLCPSWEDPAGWPVARVDGWAIPSPDGWVYAAMRPEQETT